MGREQARFRLAPSHFQSTGGQQAGQGIVTEANQFTPNPTTRMWLSQAGVLAQLLPASYPAAPLKGGEMGGRAEKVSIEKQSCCQRGEWLKKKQVSFNSKAKKWGREFQR